MTKTRNYRDLLVWQKAMLLVNKAYKTTARFPDSEKYGLANQLRRSAVSVPSNIAEGHGHSNSKDYIRFLNITMGSLFELQTQLEIAYNQEYLNDEIFKLMYDDSREIEKMLGALIRSLN
jgi:four helix bundle protein